MEDLVTFETAKLAKDNSFDGWVIEFWEKQGGEWVEECPPSYDFGYHDYNDDINTISRPTQSQLQKWVREKHSAYINITPMTIVGHIAYYKAEVALPSMVWDEPIKVKGDTYEEVLEKCLLELLKLI